MQALSLTPAVNAGSIVNSSRQRCKSHVLQSPPRLAAAKENPWWSQISPGNSPLSQTGDNPESHLSSWVGKLRCWQYSAGSQALLRGGTVLSTETFVPANPPKAPGERVNLGVGTSWAGGISSKENQKNWQRACQNFGFNFWLIVI